MNNTNLLYLLVFINYFVCSCKNNLQTNDNNSEELITFKIADTVLLNKYEEGEINYNTNVALDSIKKENISSRLILLRFTTQVNKIISNSEEIKKTNYMIISDTVEKGHFSFKFKFDSIGNRLFNATIEDIIFIKNPSLYKDKLRKITGEINISKPVYVNDDKGPN